MSQRQPKRNAYFQTTILDPSGTMSLIYPPSYGSVLPTGTLKLTIGPAPSQRTWHLPRALLARHSHTLARISANPFQTAVTLPHLDARAFANFVDYIRSSIYSLNEHVHGFRAVAHNTHAYVLGVQLGAREYSDAAVRQLHCLFEPLARLTSSNRRKSVVRAEDVEVVWRSTAKGDRLRCLFVDAVKSHWTQRDVGDIALLPGWKDLDAGFTEMLRVSERVAESERAALLRPVREYLHDSARDGYGKNESVTMLANEMLGTKCPCVRPKSRILSLARRAAASDRRRRERAEVVDAELDTVPERAGEEEHEVEDDWMAVGGEVD